MMIQIDETYAIDADKYSVDVLKKRVWGKDSKEVGKVTWDKVAYMPSVRLAFWKLINLGVQSDGLDSLGMLSERIDNLNKSITDCLRSSYAGLQEPVDTQGRVYGNNKRCSECWCYNNDPIIKEYPNTDTEFFGWRTCYYGCTVKKTSVHGCFTTKKPKLESEYQIAMRRGFESSTKKIN